MHPKIMKNNLNNDATLCLYKAMQLQQRCTGYKKHFQEVKGLSSEV